MAIRNSLRYRLLLPLLFGGIVVSLAGSAYIYHATLLDEDAALLGEGMVIASALNHGAMVAHSASEEQHVIEEVYKDSRNLALALLVSDGKVVASSIPEWLGNPVSAIPDPDLVAAIGSDDTTAESRHAITGDGRYWRIIIPLEARLSDHQHAHSPAVTDHAGAHQDPRDTDQPPAHQHADGSLHQHREQTASMAPAASPPQDGAHYGQRPEFLREDAHRPRGRIVALLDRRPAETAALASTRRLAGGVAVTIAITLLLAYLLTSRVVLTPLANMAAAMRRREAGDKGARAEIAGGDELATVGTILNGMLDTLGRAERDMHRLSQAVEQSPVSVVITDPSGIIEYANPKFCASTGYTLDELVGETTARIKSGLTPESVYADLWATITSGRRWQGELHNRNKNGELYWENVTISPILDESGSIAHYLGIKEDISVRKEYEEKLVRQANFDSLTGLPNRLLAQDRLAQAIANAERAGHGSKVALLFIDLDDFKKINDTLGHDFGDRLLKEVSARFQSCIRRTDTVARFGGDEFLVIVTEVHEQANAELVAENLLQQMCSPFVLNGIQFMINASIGIALYPDDGTDVQHLLQDADAAMYRAKREGSGQFRFFTPAMNTEAIEHLRIEEGLRHALERKELEVHFQPAIDCRDGAIVGAEALLRWNHPELGMVPPFKFIPVAERTNLIVPIGEWVLKESCRIAASWARSTQGRFRIAVNLSAKQFGGQQILRQVEVALAASGLPPQNLELEFTESVLMREDEETSRVIHQLHDMGVRFAIDDFGTGYSSISYLRQYPFDTLKIDRSFVNDVVDKPDDANLVRSIIALAGSLQLEVLAEGIETWPQFDFLQSAGANRCQGWLFSKALPQHEFAAAMAAWPALNARQRTR